MEKNYYFVIGTRAQFIKVAPVMHRMREREIPYKLIYTAQHSESILDILDTYKLPPPNITLYSEEEASTKYNFIRWFAVILIKAITQSKKYVQKPGIVLTHGDTFTAWLAALMGKLSGSKVAHIESGLRSFNLFSPFPEEISRIITFSLSDIYFCSSQWAVDNLKKHKGLKVNLGSNTLLDGVRFATESKIKLDYDFIDAPFAMVAIHRYENIFSNRFTDTIIPLLLEISQDIKLIFVLHPSTRERLDDLGLYSQLEAEPNILLHERFKFTDWIQLCEKASFVITDGGSNQEEMSYLGIPTLLLRNETERKEGLGKNIVLSKFSRKIIFDFVKNPEIYRGEPKLRDIFPSDHLIDTLEQLNK